MKVVVVNIMAKLVWRWIRNFCWAVAVAYMLAFHNVYFEEQKFVSDIAITIEEDAQVTDAAPNE